MFIAVVLYFIHQQHGVRKWCIAWLPKLIYDVTRTRTKSDLFSGPAFAPYTTEIKHLKTMATPMLQNQGAEESRTCETREPQKTAMCRLYKRRATDYIR